MAGAIQRFLMRNVIPAVGSRVFAWLGQAWRYEVIGEENIVALLADRKRPLVGAFFHGKTLAMAHYTSLPGHGPWTVMVSRSLDGDALAGTVMRLGQDVVRGSSGEGGARAFVEMVRLARTLGPCKFALAADGSRGPRCRVQMGAILLAHKIRAPIMPTAASADRALVLKRSWDRMIVPRPGARVYLHFGEPIELPRRMDSEELERQRQALEDVMCDMQRGLDRRAGFEDDAPLQGLRPEA